jgi:hypothetical protein
MGARDARTQGAPKVFTIGATEDAAARRPTRPDGTDHVSPSPPRSQEEVKREIESERERLGTAVTTLRSQARAVRRRLPFVALGAAGAGLVLRTTAKRVFRREVRGREKRGRFSFLDRD